MVAFRPIQQASHDLAVLADLFKQAGRGDRRRMLLARIRTAGKPTIAAVQARAGATLPRSGGFADLVAANVGTRSSLSSSGAWVRVKRTSRSPRTGRWWGSTPRGRGVTPCTGTATSGPTDRFGGARLLHPHHRREGPEFRSAVLQAMDDLTARLRKGV